MKLHAFSDADSGEIVVHIIINDGVTYRLLLKVLVSVAMGGRHRLNRAHVDGACAPMILEIQCQENSFRFITSFKCNIYLPNNGCLTRGDVICL